MSECYHTLETRKGMLPSENISGPREPTVRYMLFYENKITPFLH